MSKWLRSDVKKVWWVSFKTRCTDHYKFTESKSVGMFSLIFFFFGTWPYTNSIIISSFILPKKTPGVCGKKDSKITRKHPLSYITSSFFECGGNDG